MRKRMGGVLAALAGMAASLPAWAQTNVGVSVSVNQPGVYGRIDIGNVPAPPVLVYPQPVVIAPARVVQPQPIYLHVPPGHARNWSRHCRKYDACGQPVYFVQERWYQTQYVPAVQRRGDARHHDHDDDRRHGHRGRGHGHGKGHHD